MPPFKIQTNCVAPPLLSLDDAINLATWMIKSQKISVGDKIKLVDLIAGFEDQNAENKINHLKKLLIRLQASSSVHDHKVMLATQQKLVELKRQKESRKNLRMYMDFMCRCCRRCHTIPFLDDTIVLTSCCNSPLCPECILGQCFHYCSHRPLSPEFRRMTVQDYGFARSSAQNGYDLPQLRRTAFQWWHIMPPSRFLSRYPLLIKPIGRLPWITGLEYKDIVFLRKFREINLMFGFLELMNSRLFREDSSMDWCVYKMIQRIKRGIVMIVESKLFVYTRL